MRRWTVCLLVLAVLMLAATAVAEEPQREVITSGDWQYVVLEDGTAEITRYEGKAKTLEIPDTIDKHIVASIGDAAFDTFNNTLENVTIPDCVVSIASNPFVCCFNLSSIIVSPDHEYLAVIDNVLFSKPDKRLICYPIGDMKQDYQIPDGIRIIGDNAFFLCDRLTSVTIPESVTSIGECAFFMCSNLTSITIPNGVMSIGDRALEECTSLKSIMIPESVTSIGDNPFGYCNKLESIRVLPDHSYLAVIDGVLFSKPDKRLICYPGGNATDVYQIPNGIKIIGGYAFGGCESILNIIIPDSVTSIGKCAYCDCSSLSSINIPNGVTNIGKNAFTECPMLTISVPRDSYAAQYCKENKLNYTYPDVNDWLTAP